MNMRNLFIYLKLSLFQTALFILVYGTTNYLSQHHWYSFKLYTEWELSIPLIPWFILIYFSLNLLTILPAFLSSEKTLYRLNKCMTFCVLVAGLIFLIFPAPSGFVRKEVTGTFYHFYKNLHAIDFNGNTFPSLHITFAYIFSKIIVEENKQFWVLFTLWFLLICMSVIFTHQHHLIDIAGGVILGEIALRRYND